MYRASDRVDNEEWIAALEEAADSLGLSAEARANAVDLFLSHIPEQERSKPAVAAAALYVGGLVAGEERSQTAVADAMGVTRLSVQNHWKPILAEAGFEPPEW